MSNRSIHGSASRWCLLAGVAALAGCAGSGGATPGDSPPIDSAAGPGASTGPGKLDAAAGPPPGSLAGVDAPPGPPPGTDARPPTTGADVAPASPPDAPGRDALPGASTDAGPSPSPVDARPPGPAAPGGADRDGWRTWAGSFGHFSAKPSGVPLVGDLTLAKLAWKSEEATPPARSDNTSGGGASPVIANGLVYLYYYVPRGDKADDVVLALDARTGKTRWKTIYEGKGLSWQGSVQFSKNGTPAVFAGHVVAVGSAGKVYGLDATTGEKRWESDVGPLHQRLASGPKPDDSPFSSGVGFAADVALVPGYDGDSGPGHALSGLDVRTGERLWQIPGAIGTFATPSRFTHEGRDHVIAGNRAGNVRCLDPRTGRVLWELTGAGNNSFTIPVTDTHMILNGVTGGGAATDNGRFAGYRITPDGAMKVWDQPAEIPGGKLPYTAVADGKLYANFVRTNMSDPADGLFILDVATGKVLSYQKFDLKSRSVIMVADGRVILERDGSHGKTELRMFEAAMPWKGLGAEWTQLRNPTTTGYIMVLSRPFVDGMLYMRGGDAIYAWDLRAAP